MTLPARPFYKFTIDFFATGFFIGKIPKMPGTFGTLVGVVLFWMAERTLSPLALMGLVCVFIFAAILFSHLYESIHESHDSSEIVIDEIVGFMVSMMWLPATMKTFVAAFIIFRILDILKPFPISYLDKNIKGGLGVVLDDLAAGLVCNITLQLVWRFWPNFLI